MAYEQIQYEVADRIATLTLNRPDRLNAWTPKMEEEVFHAFQLADADENVRVIILTGAGRGFCAGADMQSLEDVGSSPEAFKKYQQQMIDGPGVTREGVRPDYKKTYSYFPSITKPIIGALNGPTVGLGLVVSLYCDIRFASDQSKFGTAFSRRGLIAEHGISWMLPRIVGVSNALDLLYSARMIDSTEALRMGLVNRVCPQDTLMSEVRGYAKELADKVSPRSIRVIKQQVYNALFQDLGEAIDVANTEMFKSFRCEDFQEGVAHFLQNDHRNSPGNNFFLLVRVPRLTICFTKFQ